LITDPKTAGTFKQYSFKEFESRLLSDEKAAMAVANQMVEKGVVPTVDLFFEQYMAPPKPVSPVPLVTAPPKAQSVSDVARGMVMNLPPEKQQMARQDAQDRRDEGRGWWEKTKDLGKQAGAAFDNMYSKIVQGERLLAAKQRSLLTFGEGEKEAKENEKKVKQSVMRWNSALDEKLQKEREIYNIEPSVYQAVKRGDWNRVPEATISTILDAGMQMLPAAWTGGYSMFAQTLPSEYAQGVEEIAKQTNRTPEQVIADGDDADVIAYLSAGVTGLLEKFEGGVISKAIKTKGGYKWLRDNVLKGLGNKSWQRAARGGLATTGVGIYEGAIEQAQEATSMFAQAAAPSKNLDQFSQNVERIFSSPEGQERLKESFVSGTVGGTGLVAGGRLLNRAFGGGKKDAGPQQPPTQLGGIPTQDVPEGAPEFKPEVPVRQEEDVKQQAKQSDDAIKAGQERSGFQFVSPIQALPQEAKSLIQSVSQGKMVGVQSVKDLMEGIYNEYKIFRNQQQSTNRVLTQDQIAQGISDYENTLGLLGEYISKRDGGTFMQEFAAKSKQEQAAPVAEDTEYVTTTDEELQAFKDGTLQDEARLASVEDDARKIIEGQQTLEDLPDDPNYREMVRLAVESYETPVETQDGGTAQAENGKQPYFSNVFLVKKYNPDGSNILLEGEDAEFQEQSIERTISSGIKRGLTFEQIADMLRANGHVFDFGADQTTVVNYIKNRINGTENRPFSEFRIGTNETPTQSPSPGATGTQLPVGEARVQADVSEPVSVEGAELRQMVEESAPMPTMSVSEVDFQIQNPFDAALLKLGYTEEELAGMTMEQKQDIAINKTEPARAESSAKVDAVKENAKQERFAEMQRQLDEEPTPSLNQEEGVVVEEEQVVGEVEPEMNQEVQVKEDGKKWYKAEKKITDKDGNEITLVIDKDKKTGHFYIKAADSSGNEVGSALFETRNGKVWSGNDIEVSKANRRKGIMTAMYDFAQSEGHPLVPTESLTEEGKSFWKSRKSTFGKGKNWKEVFDNTEDISLKAKVLRTIADGSKSNTELQEVLDRVNGLPEESNITWSIANNPNSSLETFEKAVSNKKLQELTSENAIKLLREERGFVVPEPQPLPETQQEVGEVEDKVLTQTTSSGKFSSKRKVTQKGIDRLEAAKDLLRGIVNNKDLTGKARADAIANAKNLVAFLDANADTRKPLKEDYFNGDKIAYTNEDAPEGFETFIYLEGSKAGFEGVKKTKEAVQERVSEGQRAYREQQEGFTRLRESGESDQSPLTPTPESPDQTKAQQPAPSPLAAFETKGQEGRKARAALKEQVGPEKFDVIEQVAKNAEKILRGLQKKGAIEIDCP
jgi:hypothetical protein